MSYYESMHAPETPTPIMRAKAALESQLQGRPEVLAAFNAMEAAYVRAQAVHGHLLGHQHRRLFEVRARAFEMARAAPPAQQIKMFNQGIDLFETWASASDGERADADRHGTIDIKKVVKRCMADNQPPSVPVSAETMIGEMIAGRRHDGWVISLGAGDTIHVAPPTRGYTAPVNVEAFQRTLAAHKAIALAWLRSEIANPPPPPGAAVI